MALQVKLDETAVGLPAPEAYARITAVTRDYGAGKLQVTVQVHAHAQARKAGKAPVSGATFEVEEKQGAPDIENGKGVRSACYEWLKTLPAFTGAKDV